VSKGRRTALHVVLTPAERQTLQHWQRVSTMAVGHVRRGRILLLLETGMSITQIARTVGMSRRHVYKWLHRFLAYGLPGLRGRRAGGRTP
jgi:transposase-like protein